MLVIVVYILHQAFHMDRMVSDARAASHQRIKRDLKPPGGGATFPASPSPASVTSLPPNLLSDLARVSHLPLLLIEVSGRWCSCD